ncbi:MAG: PKD domain-containing protein, partial [Chitinophagaceae bacterium]
MLSVTGIKKSITAPITLHHQPMYRKAFIILPLLCLSVFLQAQLCTTPGQTPVSAMLVCGVESFRVNTPVYCGNTDVPVPCPATFPYKNKNPNFFRMACSRSGSLGFTITPDETTADYNWQLFDITSTNPNDIFTNPALFIACNWSSEPGETGASADGTSLQVCTGGGEPLFCTMPYILEGHTYMLMVCNQSNSFSGYQLSFTGGTASITDDVEPHLLTARASCDWNRIIVKTNKKIVCSSLAGNGSDFMLSSGATITGAIPGDCTSIFGTDSIVLNLSQPLTLGTYSLTLNNGNDANTLMDICNRNIPEGEAITFTVASSQPTLMDSLAPVTGCSPGFIELVFQKPIRCNSIATDGSDFIITGPQAVSTTFDPGGCTANATTNRIRLKFTTPIVTGGVYQVELTTGNDSNSIIDECGLATPTGAILSFTVNNALSAAFTIRNAASCKQDSIYFLHNGNNNTSSWKWDFGNGNTSSLQNPVFLFANPGSKTIKLTVSISNCTDTSRQTIIAGADLAASFEVPEFVCPGDTV